MNVCQFNKVLYKGNINLDFYLFCLKRDIRLVRYIFINLWYYVLSYLFSSKKDIYEIRKFRYLKYVENIDKLLKEFYKNRDISNYFKLEPNIIIDKIPKIFIKNKYKGIKKILYELDDNYDVDLDKYNKDILKINCADNVYLSNKYSLIDIYSKNFFVVCGRRMKFLIERKKINYSVLQYICLFLLSFLLTCFSFLFTNSDLNLQMFYSYFEFKLFILNLLPILFIMFILFVLFKRIHISWLITSLIIFVWGIANQTKVFYRDDVVKFEDLFLIKEAIIMANECDVVIKSYTVVFGIIIVMLFFILKRRIKILSINLLKRSFLILILFTLMFFGYKNIYKNKEIYDNVGDINLVNRWIFTRQSQIRGLVYPFIYTLEDGKLVAPEVYEEKLIKDKLGKYKYKNIPKDKKVNVIAIMLEAYNDFSKFDELELNEDIYKYFHDIQKESISGNLIVNIFGGGTIDTERNFLTGYRDFSSFRKKTESYIWYFKEQGYRTEAMHPIYGAFYNRLSINPNLGFDIYYNYENKYSKIQSDFVNDDIFFGSIIENYEESVEDGVPYFNFSVTYQNHVPYSNKDYEGKEYYFDNNNMDVGLYNQINEYLYGIKRTNKSLKRLINYFDREKEPVIIVLFGDHNPALGDNALGYHKLGINISLDTIEGFLNYYQTPYVIHANDSAKKIFNNNFIGAGDDISPIFLMSEVFKNMQLKGNEYMQYMLDLKKNVDVIHDIYCKKNDEFVESKKCNKFIDEYKKVNYYMLNK